MSSFAHKIFLFLLQKNSIKRILKKVLFVVDGSVIFGWMIWKKNGTEMEQNWNRNGAEMEQKNTVLNFGRFFKWKFLT